jgi:hypothetical protein
MQTLWIQAILNINDVVAALWLHTHCTIDWAALYKVHRCFDSAYTDTIVSVMGNRLINRPDLRRFRFEHLNKIYRTDTLRGHLGSFFQEIISNI